MASNNTLFSLLNAKNASSNRKMVVSPGNLVNFDFILSYFFSY